MHLDAEDPVRVEQQPQREAPARGDAVEQGVGGQFTDTEQDVVPPGGQAPLIKGCGGVRAGVPDRPAVAPVERPRARGAWDSGFTSPVSLWVTRVGQ
ncbi:hypothetical protein GCM10010240_38980 [Streptomyces griseoviridis]|nr:hypothetical protein GCM10010240_38980 [Streptomyces griseoviridis]